MKFLSFTKSFLGGFLNTMRTFIQKRPFVSFFITLLLLFLAIVFGNILSTPSKQKGTKEIQAKKVHTYRIGSAPKVTLQAKIEKSGVINIYAQTGGIVQKVQVTEGNTVEKGTWILSLSSNYQGDDATSISRQISQQQYQFNKDTYQTQKDIIAKQRNIAGQTDVNAEQLRSISAQSIDETNSLISLNQDIISSLDSNLNQYTATNSGGVNDQLILATREMKSQFVAANNGLNEALRLTKYISAEDKPQAEIFRLTKDITFKQLDIQEKTLDLNREISRLQLNLAYIKESLMHPASPVPAVVERVYVHVGQLVNPGTLLATLSATDPEVTAVVSVPLEIAKTVSRMESSTLHIGNTAFSTIPRYISNEATDGQLYTILYSIPNNYWNDVVNAGFIAIDIPIGFANTGKTIPFVPIDAIYQTQDQSYIFTLQHGKAASKSVVLGPVYGRFVQISSGLSDGDEIITDRTVVADDVISSIAQ